jgi:hypothetical protein
MNWIFKTGDNFQVDSNNQKAIVILEQKRNFTGQEGEDVLILEKKKSDWEFTAQYRIALVEVKNPEAEFKEITITLTFVKRFEEEKLLEDYVYSLRRITNYASPIKHFSRKYSRLLDAEFEAIVEDKIYLKRTILGTVLNAMHSDHQKSFICFVASEAPEILTGKTDIDTALTLLLKYLEYAVVKPAQYLRESAELLKSIVSEQEISEIGFALDAENLTVKNTQVIKPQVDAINEYIGDMFRFNNEKLGLQLLELEDNRKFKTLFKNAPLPITLT